MARPDPGLLASVTPAAVLSRLLAAADGGAVPAALAAYTAARLPRTTEVVRWSRRAATMSTWTARPAIALRNTAAQLVGKLAPSAMLRGLGPIYDWQPPAAES